MRVLLVTGSYPPMKCGVGAYTQRLAQSLARSDSCKVILLTDRLAGEAGTEGGVEIHPVIRGWAVPNLIRIAREIRGLKPDVVHIQLPTQGYNGRGIFLLPLILRLLAIPCVQTWHEPMLGRQGLLLSLGLNHLVFVKRELLSHLSSTTNRLVRRRQRTWVPAASILPALHLSDTERASIRRQYVNKNEWVLVFYGFLAPLKGIESLLELVARTQSTLVLACDFRAEDSYHQKILARIDDLLIRDRVHIVGFVDDKNLAMLLGAADAAVFPFTEGAADWNTSIDGAVSQGVFVLTTTKSVSRYDQERNIFYAQISAVDEMQEVLRLYAGRKVNVKAADSAWEEIARAHEKIYRELLAP